MDPSALTVNPGSLRVTHPSTSTPGSYIYLQASRAYLGEHLELYGQQLTYTMKLDTGEVDPSTSQYLIVTGGRSSIGLYYSAETFVPTLTERRYEATFYETNWRVIGDERAPTVTEFQGELLVCQRSHI